MNRQKFCLLLLLALLSLVLGKAQTAGRSRRDGGDNENQFYRDVCVLGGGASGAYFAALMKDKGKSVVVIDSDFELGGSCETYYFPAPSPSPSPSPTTAANNGHHHTTAPPPTPAPLAWVESGVQIFPDTAAAKAAGVGNWTVDTVAEVKRFAGPDAIIPINFNDLELVEETFLVDIAANFPIGYVPPSPPTTGYLEAFEAYNIILSQYPWLADYSYPDVIPPELLVSLTEFIEVNNLEPLAGLFNGFILGGQGNSDDIVALYGLTQMNQIVLRLIEVVNASFFVNNGCTSIYRGIANYLGPQNVLVNATTVSVHRPSADDCDNGRNRLSIVAGYNSYTYKPFLFLCDKVAISFPQTLQTLDFVDLDAVETDLFSTVSYTYYFGGIINVNGGQAANTGTGFQVVNVNPEAFLDQPTYPGIATMTRTQPFGPANVFSVSPTPRTEDEMFTLVAAGLRNVSSTILNATLVSVDLHQFRPVPGVQTLQVQPNFYKRGTAIQGYRNTYWLGSVWTAAGTFCVWNHALNIANQYF